MNNIDISVIMPSYNHEKYVTSAIHSVLQQVDASFELLIEDDGSTDNSHEIIGRISDPRIHFVRRKENIGACNTLNNLIQRSQGKYIAIINSDDVWLGTNKLAKQREFLDSNNHIAACFGRARYIDNAGNTINKSSILLGGIFDVSNISQSDWIRRFFDSGNCLCHPTIMIRRDAYKLTGLYDNRLRQIPDFDIWTNLIKHSEIYVAEDEMIEFRLIEGGNTSAPTVKNSIRLMNEYEIVYEKFLDGIGVSLFQDAFGDIMAASKIQSEAHFEIEKALLYLQRGHQLEAVLRSIGLRKMYRLLGQVEAREILRSSYNISDAWFHEQMAQYSPFYMAPPLNHSEQPATPQTTSQSTPTSKKDIFQNLPILRYFLK
jgi:glycosyltransferase involved in cell wall biosynthesis